MKDSRCKTSQEKGIRGDLTRFRRFSLLAFGLLVLVAAPSFVSAATYTVSKTADTNDGACDADCSLREAVIAANANAGADTINLPAGTYTITIPGTAENAAATGDLDITDGAGLTVTGGGQATTTINGGGLDRIFHIYGAATVSISDLTITNGAPGNVGGAIYSNGASLTLTRVSVTGNNAGASQGGGVYNSTTFTLNEVDISSNTGGGGGGIYSSGTVTINGGTISNNTGTSGGGIQNSAGTLTIDNAVINNNTGTSSGGGIYGDGATTLTNVTISTNTSPTGSGINFKGTLNLTHVTLYGNITGKGIDKITGPAPTTSFKNTIIAGNAAGNCSQTFTSAGYNLESTTNTCGFTGTGDQNSVSAGNLNIGALANNGGPTQTHALLAGSFAIDQIPNATNGCGTTITTDQRGIARPQNGTCDVGAYEYVPGGPSTTLGDGATPANRNVGRSTTNRAVDAFTLSTSAGTDTLTALTVTLSGTGAAADIAASGVKIWKDNGTVANEWDAGDTQIGSGVSMSGSTATFSGLTESITTTSVQYLITYDISATATPANTLLGAVTAATTTNALTNNDTTDNTLTVAAVSGTVYTDEGATNIGSGKTVKLVKAGTGGNSDTTDAFGRYAIAATLIANDLILVYIANDATYKANTVTKVSGAAISGLDLYAGRVITRCDNACSLTIANMSTALGAYTDAGDILYSMAGSLTVSGTGTAINVPVGHTFAPGAAITVTPALEVRGTFTAGSFTHTLSGTGTPLVVTGTFTPDTSTIKYTGTTTATNIATTNYFNLQLAPTAATTYSLTGNLTGANALTGNLTVDLNATLDATTANNYNLTAVTATINFLGTYLAKASTITLGGSWSNTGTFTAGTSIVIFNGTSGTKTITPNGQSFYNIAFNDGGGTATYQLQGALTATNDLTVTDGILDTKAGSNFAINVTRDFTQSSLGKVLAQSSTVTVGRDISLNGTADSTSWNAASLVMTGTGAVTYTSLLNGYANGFYNLTAGQSGNTTTLNNKMSVLNLVTIGTGTLTSATSNIQLYLYKTGTPPFVFDPASTVSVGNLQFFANPATQYLPPLANGYSSNIRISYYTNLTQSGDVTINPGFSLILDGDLDPARWMTYSTAGYALNVGGNIQIGNGGETALRTFNGTGSAITVGGNFDVVPKGAGTTQAVFTSTGSTVTFNGSGAQTARLTGSNFNNLAITNASAAGVSFLDAFNAANITDTTAGSKLTFKAGATYAISGTLTLTGTSGSKIVLLSDLAGTRFTLNVTGGAQVVNYVNVKDSQASTNNIIANNWINSGGNDDLEAAPHWIFDSCPTVTSTADSGVGTLRGCMNYANVNPGATISFNIPGPGNQSSGADSWWRISPTSALPTITANGTLIDGATQTTNQGNTNTLGPEIEINGGSAGAGVAGLTINNVGAVTIRGLAINGFTNHGITITGASATGNIIEGNTIGLNATGSAALANANHGVYLTGGANGNIIGGASASQRNLISGNSWHGIYVNGVNSTVIKGNYLGTNRAASAKIPNGIDGVKVDGAADGTIIGGAAAGEGNIASGNGDEGIDASATPTNTTIYGNIVGTGTLGTEDLGNTGNGIEVANAGANTYVGGLGAGQGNIIAFGAATGAGIAVGGTSSGVKIEGNTLRNNYGRAIYIASTGVIVEKNLIYSNGATGPVDAIDIVSGGTNAKIYHNTIHGNAADGISVGDTGSILRNNLITGSGGYGINRVAASMTESYNDVTDAATTPANALGRSNVALDATDLNANPQYTNAGAGDFTLQLTSLAINRGCDLGAAGDDTACDSASDGAQPDINGASAGNYNGYAPDMGAFESSVTSTCPVSATADGTAPVPWGSLRACITYANSNPGTIVSFSIAPPGNQSSGADSWWRIAPASALPAITANGTVINAATQTTNISNANSLGPEIEINGAGAGAVSGIDLTSANNVIRGLIVNGFSAAGSNAVRISGVAATGNTIAGNYLGTNYAGTAGASNYRGVLLINGAQSNTIGGTIAADRNILSGNTDAGAYISSFTTQLNLIQGNYIGLAPDGATAVANNYGVFINGGQNNTLGGAAAGAGNVISGNTTAGAVFYSSNTQNNSALGNKIGANATATGAVANGIGVYLYFGTISNNIGGSAAGAGNVVSGNTNEGVLLFGSGTDLNTVKGNYIGTNTGGTAALPNTTGVTVSGDAQSNVIGGTAAGEGNIIALNTQQGILLTGALTDNNKLSGNSVYSNGALGIDLDPVGVGAGGGSNNDKARPTLTGITPNGANFTIVATVTAGDTVEFFRINNGASPAVTPDGTGSGEGYLFLGSCVDNGACSGPHVSAVADANPAAGTVQATLLTSGVNGGDFVSATATDASNNTSEFSANSQVPLNLVKQVWQVGGTTPLAKTNGAPSSVTVPSGETVVFLIYVKNPGSSDATDIRFSDLLDVSASGFDYVAGSLVRDDGSLSDAATDLAIFNATAPGTGTALTDAVDGDVGSVCDSGAGACPGTTLNRVTAGNTTGLTPAQANGTLSIAANKTFAIRFRAVKK